MWLMVARRGLAYRVEWVVGVLQMLLVIWIKIAIWTAILNHAPQEAEAAAITVAQMATYVAIVGVLRSILRERLSLDLEKRLKTGDIACDLTKPVGLPALLAARSLGEGAADLASRCVPVLVTAFALWGLLPPPSPQAAALALAAVAVAILLAHGLGFLLGTLGFWTLRTTDYSWFLFTFVRLVSGEEIPYWFLPPWLAAVGRALPFHLFANTPAGIYVGRISPTEAVPLLLAGTAWTALVWAAVLALWQKTLRRLVVQGG